MPVPPPEDLYPALLGPAWASLPSIVRRLHQEGHAGGQLTIELGRHWLSRLLARILGFPPAGEFRTHLVVEGRGEEQVWSRRFGEHEMSSRQRRQPGGLLAERFGPFECAFRLRPTERGLDYDFAGAALALGGLRLPLPRRLAPRVDARTWAEEDAMRLDISISAPLVGRIARYHGLVRPEGNEVPS